jgi:hypothetical protein
MHRMWSGKRAACSPGDCLVNCRYDAPFSCFVVSPLRGHGSFVTNFAQKVMTGQLPLSVRRLSGERVELFGRSEALFPSCNFQNYAALMINDLWPSC